jgi:uncharacterized membrane protein
MGEPGHRLSRVLTAHAVVGASLSITHSLRARGLRRTLLFAALGNAIPVLGELFAVNVLRLLRHHTRPRAGGVPLAIALGWYNVGYGTFAVTESLLIEAGLREGGRRQMLAPATALLATDLDLMLDPFGLDLGLWEWNGEGSYARGVRGPNGERGVPLLNFAGWLALISSIALAYRLLAPGGDVAGRSRPGEAGSPEAGRTAALLLLPYYLPAATWALKRRRRKYLLYSAPFAAALWVAFKRHPPAPEPPP